MSALTPWWKRVGFEDPFSVERNLTIGAIAGIAVAVVGGLFTPVVRDTGPHPLLTLLLCVLQVALPKRNRWLMLGVVAITLSFGAIFEATVRTLPWFCALALGGTLAFEGSSWLRRVALALGPALGDAWCLALAQVFSAKYLGSARMVSWGVLACSGVLVTAAASLSSLTFSFDALEVRLRLMDPKVRETWQRFHQMARRFSPSAQRQLVDLGSTVASRWLDARLEQREVERSLERVQMTDALAAIERLEQRLLEVSDPELRAHLEQSLRVHRDSVEQLNGLRRRVERAEARALAELSWLDTAVLTLELTPTTEDRVMDATSRLTTLATRHAPLAAA